MQIQERAVGDLVVLDLHGKITAGQGDAGILHAIGDLTTRGMRNIVLNLAGVSYMDTIGLSTLVQAQLKLRQAGGRLMLLHVPARIMGLLAVTKLTTVFETFDSETAAVASVTGRTSAGSGTLGR